MDVDVADPVSGESIIDSGEAGEMVVRLPFPSMPCFFWGDHDGSRYRSSYFERFDNIDVWAQHDWLQKMPFTGGLVMHGRSDGVLSMQLWAHFDHDSMLTCEQIHLEFDLARARFTPLWRRHRSMPRSQTACVLVAADRVTKTRMSSYSLL